MATHCIDLWNQKRINLVAATKQSAQIFFWTRDNMTTGAQLHLWFDSSHYYKNFLQKHKFRACGSKFRAIHLHSIQKIGDFVRKFCRVLTFDCEFMFSIVWGGILRHFRQVCKNNAWFVSFSHRFHVECMRQMHRCTTHEYFTSPTNP